MTANQPLKDQRIIITRPKHSCSELSLLFQEKGAVTIEFPTIELKSIVNQNQLLDIMNHIDRYDWILWTSPFGVEVFIRHIRQFGFNTQILHEMKIAAIGTKTAEKIVENGLSVDCVPEQYNAEGLLQKWDELGLRDQKVLLVRAKEAREILPDTLRNQFNCDLKVLPVYSNEIISYSKEEILAVFTNAQGGWITFTSGSAVSNLINNLQQFELIHLLKQFRIACLGPVTAEVVQRYSLIADVVAPHSTLDQLVVGISRYISS